MSRAIGFSRILVVAGHHDALEAGTTRARFKASITSGRGGSIMPSRPMKMRSVFDRLRADRRRQIGQRAAGDGQNAQRARSPCRGSARGSRRARAQVNGPSPASSCCVHRSRMTSGAPLTKSDQRRRADAPGQRQEHPRVARLGKRGEWCSSACAPNRRAFPEPAAAALPAQFVTPDSRPWPQPRPARLPSDRRRCAMTACQLRRSSSSSNASLHSQSAVEQQERQVGDRCAQQSRRRYSNWKLAFRAVALAANAQATCQRSTCLDHAHRVLGQGTRLVGTNHGRAAEGFDGGQFANQRMVA